MQNDPNIDTVKVTDNEVDMSYRQNARLFGFIPVSVDANTTVTSDGGVHVHYPWYRFLLALGQNNTVDSGTLKTDLSATAGIGTTSGTASAFTPSQQAGIVSEIDAYMQAHSDVSANSSVSAQ